MVTFPLQPAAASCVTRLNSQLGAACGAIATRPVGLLRSWKAVAVGGALLTVHAIPVAQVWGRFMRVPLLREASAA